METRNASGQGGNGGRKSTHKGHCQACGRLQMLPKGELAKHGYTVTYGYFSGVCAGSGALPFEQSCELVKTYVERATTALEGVVRTQVRLQELPTDAKAWMRVYYKGDGGYGRFARKSGYEWTLCPMTIERHGTSGASGDEGIVYFTYTYTDKNGKVHGGLGETIHGVEAYNAKGRTDDECLLATCQQHNTKKAEWLEHEADSLRRYIAWQTERVENWTEQELLPVENTDKQGFIPTEARY